VTRPLSSSPSGIRHAGTRNAGIRSKGIRNAGSMEGASPPPGRRQPYQQPRCQKCLQMWLQPRPRRAQHLNTRPDGELRPSHRKCHQQCTSSPALMTFAPGMESFLSQGIQEHGQTRRLLRLCCTEVRKKTRGFSRALLRTGHAGVVAGVPTPPPALVDGGDRHLRRRSN
jgi:hypothetical protein